MLYYFVFLKYKTIIKLLINKKIIITTKDNCGHMTHNMTKKTGSDHIIKILNNKKTKFIIYKNCIIQF